MVRPHRRRLPWIALLVSLVAVPAGAALPKDVKKQAKEMLKGTLYMRIDAPCATGRHAYGTYKRPLVEVTPAKVNTDGDLGMNASWWHADSTFWGIRINDPVTMAEFGVDEGVIEIELEGTGPAEGNATVIKLVDVNTMEELQAAFDLAFAHGPLQDEHPDWPADIKQAIAERRLVPGMTKRQASYVTGNPESFSKTEEDGKTVETWTLRTSAGTKMGYWSTKTKDTGMPSSIRFVDGSLVDVTVGAGEGVNLDD